MIRRSGIAGVLLGSQAHKVVTHSKIPVLVYHQTVHAIPCVR
jgi:nucleotide-binding universal stress UspA family protein